MAKTTKLTNISIKPKAITKGPAKAALNVIDFMVPKTPMDVALYAVPWGRGIRKVGGIVGKGARTVSKVYRNMGR
jgi:hypothetical protein